MKLSADYMDFKAKLDMLHPAYGRTLPLDLDYDSTQDTGKGI